MKIEHLQKWNSKSTHLSPNNNLFTLIVNSQLEPISVGGRIKKLHLDSFTWLTNRSTGWMSIADSWLMCCCTKVCFQGIVNALRSVIGSLKKFGTLCLLNRCFVDNWLGVWGGRFQNLVVEVDSLILRCQIFKLLVFHLVFWILSQHAGIRREHWYLNLYLWAAAARQWAAALDLIQTLFSVWLARQCLSSLASLLYFSILTFSCICSI